jgi:hypothetical protein
MRCFCYAVLGGELAREGEGEGDVTVRASCRCKASASRDYVLPRQLCAS